MMQYFAYFAVATPLLLAWLFWASATVVSPDPAPLFHSFDEDLHQAAVLKERALADLNSAQSIARVAASESQSQALSARAMTLPIVR
jgi:hypothetical protein